MPEAARFTGGLVGGTGGSEPGSAGLPGSAAGGELVTGRRRRLLGGALGRQLGEGALDLAPHTADGDAEDALPALEQVDDLVVAGALVDRGAVAHQGHARQVVGAALTQVGGGGADLLQRDAGVEEPLDDLEDQDVAEGVEPLRPGAGGAADARLDQAGAGPVVELAVGDAGGVARRRAAVAGVARERRYVVSEEQTLLLGEVGGLGLGLHARGVGALLVLVASHSDPPGQFLR